MILPCIFPTHLGSKHKDKVCVCPFLTISYLLFIFYPYFKLNHPFSFYTIAALIFQSFAEVLSKGISWQIGFLAVVVMISSWLRGLWTIFKDILNLLTSWISLLGSPINRKSNVRSFKIWGKLYCIFILFWCYTPPNWSFFDVLRVT